jgi:hypothetical protein
VLRDGVALLASAGCTEAKVGVTAITTAAAKMQNDGRNMCLSLMFRTFLMAGRNAIAAFLRG